MFWKFLFSLVLLIAFEHLPAQKILIGGTEGVRQLQWSDFAGKPDENSVYFAYTAYSTKFKFDDVQFNGDKAIISGFEMTLEFDKNKSWVKKGKETEELLKHEQGHFDVGLLYMQEVLQKMTGANFTRAGYKEEFQKLISDIHQKYKDMGFQYDKETNHSIKKDEQKRWDTFFNESVKR